MSQDTITQDNESLIALDNTKRKDLELCERKYYLGRKRQYAPIRGSHALRYGSTWHAFQEGYYSHIKDYGWTRDGEAVKQAIEFASKEWKKKTSQQSFIEDDYRTFENCAQSFLEYIVFFQSDESILEVVATEQVFELEMKLSDDEKRLFPALEGITILFTGKLDLQAKLNEAPWIIDFKSTGQSLGTQSTRLNRSAQLMGYSYAGARTLSFEPSGTLVSLHQLSSRKSKVTGNWGKLTIDFQRVPQIFTDKDIQSWRLSYLSTCEKLIRAQVANCWPMQSDVCFQYGRCIYANLCEQNLSIEQLEAAVPEGYIHLPWDVRAE